MKAGWGLLLAFGFCWAQSGKISPEVYNPKNYLEGEKLAPFTHRILFEREPFMKSDEARKFPATMLLFFTKEEYERLEGNPILGYWNQGSFQWPSDCREVDFEPFPGKTRYTDPIKAKAWEQAWEVVSKKYGLTRKKGALIVIRGACVAANMPGNAKGLNPGVVTECRIRSPKGTLLYRLGMGKPSLGAAIGANLDYLVAYAMKLDGKTKTRDEMKKEMKEMNAALRGKR